MFYADTIAFLNRLRYKRVTMVYHKKPSKASPLWRVVVELYEITINGVLGND